MKQLLILLTFTVSSLVLPAQSKKEKAMELGRKAIEIMDLGQLDESIGLLQEAQKLDPAMMDYPYEIAFAYYQKGDYEKSLDYSRPLLKHKNVTDRVFQMVGNTYDMMGKKEKAIETYEQGMKKFSQSGRLYLEAGVVELSRDRINEAVGYWEKGIKADPNHSSNYYWLSKTFAQTDEKVWALLYGEIFMLLEYNSKRTSEISQLLFKTIQQTYTATSDTTARFDLTKKGFNIVLSKASDFMKLKNFGLPFEGTYTMVYSGCGVKFRSGINLSAIHEERVCFLEKWFTKYATDYPNALFDFQKRMSDAGMFEAYNYWLVSQGDYAGFEKWLGENPGRFDTLAAWIKDNPISLNPKDTYSRLDYIDTRK